MGPKIDIKFSSTSRLWGFSIKPNIDYSTVTSGWKVMLDSDHKEVCINQFMFTLTNHVCCVYTGE